MPESNLYCEIGVYEPKSEYLFWEKEILSGEQVILVEPMYRCVNMINEYIKDKPNVKLHPVAIGDSVGLTSLWDEGASAYIDEAENGCPAIINGYYNVPDRPKLEEHRNIVALITFDVIDPGNITHLKVDIEGGEWWVLKHMKSRPSFIQLEWSQPNGGWHNPFQKEIRDWMDINGYKETRRDGWDIVFEKHE